MAFIPASKITYLSGKMEKTSFKEWLEKQAEKEGLKIKVRFTKDDYTTKVRKDGTMEISECWFDKTFTSEERRAVGAHEIAHLKYRHYDREGKWLDRKIKKYSLFFLVALLLAVGLGLSGLDDTLSTAVIIGILAAIAIRFLRQVLPQYFHLKRLHELEADKYAAETVGPAPQISYFEKSDRLVEEWRKKGLRWRAIIWYREKTHPSKNERIERLKRMS